LPFSFRDIEYDDLPVVVEMIGELAAAEGRPEAATITLEQLNKLLFASPQVAYGIVGIVNGEIVGYALFALKFSSFKGYLMGYLEDILIRPQYQRSGLGKPMMVAVTKKALALGCEHLEWSALNTNLDAIGFYDHIGAEREQGRTHFELDYEALKDWAR